MPPSPSLSGRGILREGAGSHFSCPISYQAKLDGKKRDLEGAARRLSGWLGQFRLAEDEGGDRSEEWTLETTET